MPPLGGYTALGHPRAGARAGGDVAQFPARLHRRAVVRPRRLFRAWRLWRGADAEIPGRQHAAGARCRHCCSAASPARSSAPLIVRRRGVYFAMVTIAFGQVFYYIAFQWSSLTGGDDGLRGFSRQPIDFGLFKLDILPTPTTSTIFVLFCFALAVGVMGFMLRSPFGRTMIAIRENERRARFLGIPVERHIWISFTLSCFFMGFAGALYALRQQLRRPAGPALQPVRRFRHDGGDGRHAHASGGRCSAPPCSWCCRITSRADRQLDVLRRPALRAGGAVLPARPARHASQRRRAS